jgi:hypothetical protein
MHPHSLKPGNPVLGRHGTVKATAVFRQEEQETGRKNNSPTRQFPPYKVISKKEYFITTSATHNHQTTNQNKTRKQLLAIDMKLRKPQKNEEEQILEV